MNDNKRKEILTKAKPILFNTEMVRAILDGRKTQTRRVALPNKDLREFKINKYPDGWWLKGRVYNDWSNLMHDLRRDKGCKYQVDDILYVRETWAINSITQHDFDFVYKADYDCAIKPYCEWKWKPSIHMPKEAARIFLKVTKVSVKRLHDIYYFEYLAEGLPYNQFENHLQNDFQKLWDSTIKKSDFDKYGWAANPWVWVIKFERINLDEKGKQSIDAVIERLEELPVVKPEPVRHGEWIPDDYGFFHCSECQFEHDDSEYVTPYCPNCGAKMEDEY